jgi:ribosome biogenesis protein Nip4
MIDGQSVVKKSQRYYFLNQAVRRVVNGDFYYAGLYLGKEKEGKFFPSFNLLDMLMDFAANKVVLNRRAAWLFICGRDVFRSGILKAMGSQRKSDFTLVLNEFGECLGFGMITHGLSETGDRVSVLNVLDIGDFLRREK